uniref:Uncharacterized protein n=1 Tax=Avena sativa TaxID=4498 RepID=A0ACD5XZV4_AVESA
MPLSPRAIPAPMESSPVRESEEIEGGFGSSVRRQSRRLQPTRAARVPAEDASRIAGAKREGVRTTAVWIPVRCPILGMMPLRARSASPTFGRSPSTTAPGSPIAISTVKPFVYLPNLETTQLPQHHFTLEDLPEALLAEIIRRITCTSDLNSFSLVSKLLYTVEAHQRNAIHVGSGLCPATEALASLCTRFPNLCKVEIDYCGWTPDHGNQLDSQGFLAFSSRCPSLTDLTLSFCLHIHDSGLGCLAYCKKLMSLRLNSAPKITSGGLFWVVVACKSLCALHLVDCHKIGSAEWLEYLGWNGILEELVVKNCEGISQYDLLKFGPGWVKLKKFEFMTNAGLWDKFHVRYDLSYDAHNPSRYDFCCEHLKDLRLTRFTAGPEVGLRNLLGKCKSLEKLCLEYVHGLNDNDMIALSQSCSNLRSISLWLTPIFYGDGDDCNCTTSFTDNSLKALALNCPMLETVELTFGACEPWYPSEIAFTQKGLVAFIKSCPIRVLVLNGANFFDDEGMKALSFAPFLETLELMDCQAITDVGMRFIVDIPCLSSLALRCCELVTDSGMTELVHAQKLDSLSIEQCPQISLEAVQGAARSVHYSINFVSHSLRGKRMFIEDCS